jgi:hypothetical protein
VRVATLFYQRLRLLEECQCGVVPANGGFPPSANEPKLDMGPGRQGVIAKAKFGLPRREEVVASL